MERDMFQRVLGVAVRREQRQAGGTHEVHLFDSGNGDLRP